MGKARAETGDMTRSQVDGNDMTKMLSVPYTRLYYYSKFFRLKIYILERPFL